MTSLDVSTPAGVGKKVIAGRALRDKREAEWLAATIEQAVGELTPAIHTPWPSPSRPGP